MRCKECPACTKGYFKSRPDEYVCTGVPEPFIIPDITRECPEYPSKRMINKLPTYCYGLVDEIQGLMQLRNCPKLFLRKHLAQAAADKYNEKHKRKISVVTFRMEQKE